MLNNMGKNDKWFVFFFCVFIILSLCPLWYFDYVPMVDAPQHVTQLSQAISILKSEDYISSDYYINLYTPYVTSNVILLIFTYLFGPIASIKLAVSAYLIILPYTSYKLTVIFNRRKELSLMTFPILYGVGYNWGFIPYLVTISFACLWFLRFVKRGADEFDYLDVILSILVAFSHAIAWGLIGLHIASYYIYKHGVRNVYHLWKISWPLIVIILWMYVNSSELDGSYQVFVYMEPLSKLYIFLLDNISNNKVTIGVTIFVSFFLMRRNCIFYNSDSKIGAVLLSTSLIVYILMPTSLMSTAFVSDRLPILIPVFLPLIFGELRNLHIYYFLIFFVVLITSFENFNRYESYNSDNDKFISSIEKISENTSLFYIANKGELYIPQEQYIRSPYYLHFAHWASEKKNLDIEFSFSYFSNVLVKKKSSLVVGQETSFNIDSVDWEGISDFDYVLIKSCNENTKVPHVIERNLKYNNSCYYLFE
ncbi:hypothetical protein [Vibrio atypicus]|uniref:hypothetical protein n=1 Tax=Vibrio atypicus TaxID=558271 RepID=UPI00135ABBF3|nr:hypothetical protein [Vibrio atypicus]